MKTKHKKISSKFFPSSDLSERDSNEIIELRSSKRAIIEKMFGSDCYTFLVKEVPQTYNKAIKSRNAYFK